MNVAIVGACGWAGSRHLEAYRKLGIRISHLCDPAPGAASMADSIGARLARDIEDLLDPAIDAVSVALPPALQPAMCRPLIAAGRAVLCEKPLADDIEAATELARAADAGPAPFMTAFLLRFHPVYQAIRAKLRSGDFGAPLALEIDSRVLKTGVGGWRQDSHQGGACLVNGIHSYDLARWLLGGLEGPKHAVAGNRFFVGPVEDWLDAVLTGPGGTVVSLRCSWWPFRDHDEASDDMEGWVMRLRLVCERGIVWQRHDGWRVVHADGREESFKIARPDLFVEEIRHFVQCVRDGGTPEIGPWDGVAAQQLVSAAVAAAGGRNLIRPARPVPSSKGR